MTSLACLKTTNDTYNYYINHSFQDSLRSFNVLPFATRNYKKDMSRKISFFEKLQKSAIEKCKEIYKYDFKKTAYSLFFKSMEKFCENGEVKLYCYPDSARFDISYKNTSFIIEYSSEDDFLTVTKKDFESLTCKECIFDDIESTLESLVNG